MPANSLKTPEALFISGLHKRFSGADWVVRGVDLSIPEGEILSVLGPSGCGKTTLLRLIAGFETPERGEISQHGEVVSRPGWVLPPERRRIGMVFQEYTLFPHLTVRKNVQFGLEPGLAGRMRGWLGGSAPVPDGATSPATGDAAASAPKGEAAAGPGKIRLVNLMEMCGLMEIRERYPHELSGGQQQRVALARALATAPRMLLLDEPFSNLDTTLRQRLREEVRNILKRAGITSILVTHDQEEAINMGDRLAVMNQGRLEQVGTPLEVLQRPANRFVAAFIGLNRFLPGTVEGERLVTELGGFDLPPEGSAARRVDVLLRANQVTLCPNGGGVPAQVVQVRFLSGQPLYTLALPSGLEIQALLPGAGALHPGAMARIRFDPAPLVFFPAE